MKKEIRKLLTGGTLVCGASYGLYKWISNAKSDDEEDIADSYRYRRLECYYDIMTKWMELKLHHISIAEYLKKQGIQKIVIYGHGKIGILLYQELVQDGIKVEYFLDGVIQPDYCSIDNTLVTILKRLPAHIETDAMIVTPSHDFKEIKKGSRKEGYAKPILSLSHLLYQVE